MVIPSSSKLSFKVESRSESILLSMDSQSKVVTTDIEMKVQESNFKIQLVNLDGNHYFDALRKKLNWGLDIRN